MYKRWKEKKVPMSSSSTITQFSPLSLPRTILSFTNAPAPSHCNPEQKGEEVRGKRGEEHSIYTLLLSKVNCDTVPPFTCSISRCPWRFSDSERGWCSSAPLCMGSFWACFSQTIKMQCGREHMRCVSLSHSPAPGAGGEMPLELLPARHSAVSLFWYS